jgi:integrase
MSVRKRKWTNGKGETRESWVVSYSTKEGGKRYQHIETFDRKKDADARHAQIKVDLGRGTHVPPSQSITVAEATELWLQACASRELEIATLDQYRGHTRLHIVPLIGEIKLTDLTVAAVRGFEDRLRLDRSISLVPKVLTTLSSILSDSFERGLVARNIVSELRRNRRGAEGKAARRAKVKLKAGVHIPTPQEVRAIIEHATQSNRALLITAAFTGLRASELRGLRWIDVDLEANELHVTQRADIRKRIGVPKSAAGKRTVPFGKYVANTLREHKLKSGGSELVFPNYDGGVISLPAIIKGLKSACVRAGVVTQDGKAKYTGMHAFRHFYASWSINRVKDGGCELPPKVVQERLGHANISMTLDTYGHLFPRGDDSAILDAAEGMILG